MAEKTAGKTSRPEQTRLIAMGSAALTEGFSLLGFETYPDATAEELEAVLKELVRKRHQALIFLEDTLARQETSMLRRVRIEEGRIVVVEVPPLQAPENHHLPVEQLVRRVLGAGALDTLENGS